VKTLESSTMNEKRKLEQNASMFKIVNKRLPLSRNDCHEIVHLATQNDENEKCSQREKPKQQIA